VSWQTAVLLVVELVGLVFLGVLIGAEWWRRR